MILFVLGVVVGFFTTATVDMYLVWPNVIRNILQDEDK